jgi:hypothetical protein
MFKSIHVSFITHVPRVDTTALLCTKGKGKVVLCLTKHRAMKKYGGIGGIAPCILDLGTRWR